DLLARVALRPQWEGDVVPNGQVGIEPVALKHHGDAASARRQVVDYVTADPNLAGRGFLQPGNNAKKRGLAAPRGTEQHHELAVARLQADAGDGDDLGELFSDVDGRNRSQLDLPGHAGKNVKRLAVRSPRTALAFRGRRQMPNRTPPPTLKQASSGMTSSSNRHPTLVFPWSMIFDRYSR